MAKAAPGCVPSPVATVVLDPAAAVAMPVATDPPDTVAQPQPVVLLYWASSPSEQDKPTSVSSSPSKKSPGMPVSSAQSTHGEGPVQVPSLATTSVPSTVMLPASMSAPGASSAATPACRA